MDEEKAPCTKCGKDLGEDEQNSCDECNDLFCADCCIQFENLNAIVCKLCIDKVYPREVVEKVVEKIVEVPKEDVTTPGFSEPIL